MNTGMWKLVGSVPYETEFVNFFLGSSDTVYYDKQDTKFSLDVGEGGPSDDTGEHRLLYTPSYYEIDGSTRKVIAPGASCLFTFSSENSMPSPSYVVSNFSTSASSNGTIPVFYKTVDEDGVEDGGIKPLVGIKDASIYYNEEDDVLYMRFVVGTNDSVKTWRFQYRGFEVDYDESVMKDSGGAPVWGNDAYYMLFEAVGKIKQAYFIVGNSCTVKGYVAILDYPRGTALRRSDTSGWYYGWGDVWVDQNKVIGVSDTFLPSGYVMCPYTFRISTWDNKRINGIHYTTEWGEAPYHYHIYSTKRKASRTTEGYEIQVVDDLYYVRHEVTTVALKLNTRIREPHPDTKVYRYYRYIDINTRGAAWVNENSSTSQRFNYTS